MKGRSDSISRLLAAIVVVSLSCLSLGAESPADRAEAMVRSLMESTEIPGLSVSVGQDGDILWSNGFGVSSLELGTQVTRQTRFRAASVSKILTVAAAARLVAMGKLDLDAPIQRYVPAFPDKGQRISLRQLAGHLGGIRHYRFEDFQHDREHFESLGDALGIFAEDPLAADPGVKYQYSTFGYTLIGAAIEEVCGSNFLPCIEQLVFEPLAMTRSGGDILSMVIRDRTAFYDRDQKGEIENARSVDPSYKWPGGGLLTTPDDLVRFGMAHLNGDFLSEKSRNEVFVSQKTTDGAETGVGIGWRIGTDPRGRVVFHHSGSMSGARSTLVLFPESGLVVSLMTNLDRYPAFVERTAFALAEVFLSQSALMQAPSKELEGVFDFVGEYAGGSLNGRIELDQGRRGTMTTPAPLVEFMKANGQPVRAELPIVNVSIVDGRQFLVVAMAYGLLEIPIEIAGDEFGGTLQLGRNALEFTATPVGR